MIVSLSDELLNEPRWYSLLDVVAELVQAPQMRLSFDIGDIAKIGRSGWVASGEGGRAGIAQLAAASIKATSRGTASDATTIHLDGQAAYAGEDLGGQRIAIHPLSGIAFLTQPFHLIVEDQHTDGGFVLWMARLTGRDEVIQAYRSGRFVFRHAGGKGQISKSADALSSGVWGRPGQPISAMKNRAGVMLDSDDSYPGQQRNLKYVEDSVPHVSFVHLLSGRTIENYVPAKYFRRRLADDGLAGMSEAFFRLTELQRLHFPIKDGFKPKEKGVAPPSKAEFLADPAKSAEQKHHLASVDPGDWQRLASGFGERLAAVYTNPAYRCEPKDAVPISANVRAEIDQLLTRLLRHL
ncbi:hypothetical protein [Brevundimonas naejangsanensis]|uniref:hypothetical protein n=1 Tax=Brevundimonas naejangsanensis TaxID=588932 RepID=UPI0026EA8781|nr:hypothetical protein [Brevundimonas naejangsanensis]